MYCLQHIIEHNRNLVLKFSFFFVPTNSCMCIKYKCDKNLLNNNNCSTIFFLMFKLIQLSAMDKFNNM